VTFPELLGQALAKIRALPSSIWKLEAKFKGAQCAPDVLFLGRPLISRCAGSTMIFSEGVRIHSALRSNPMGCFQPAVLRTMTPEARLELAQNVGLSAAVIVAGNSIVIGEGTIIGAGAMILDNDFHAPGDQWKWICDYKSNARPVRIGRGVFVGARAIILKGVTIGDRAVIGAGAVVSRDVPAGAIAVGNPAMIKGRKE